jgi:hypothetical protein
MALQWNGPRVTQAVTGASLQGLNQAAEYVRSRTVPLTPLRDGDLRASLHVSEATKSDPVAAVYTNLPYAVRQHEELGYTHRDGQAKYLEVVANRARKKVSQIVSTAVRRATQ